jgi:hypothetical protein
MNVPSTEAIVVVDSGDQLVGFVLQNTDPANDVWVSSDQNTLNQEMGSGVATVAPTDQGIKIAAGGPPLVVPFFTGKWYGRALNATVNLRKELWRAILP